MGSGVFSLKLNGTACGSKSLFASRDSADATQVCEARGYQV